MDDRNREEFEEYSRVFRILNETQKAHRFKVCEGTGMAFLQVAMVAYVVNQIGENRMPSPEEFARHVPGFVEWLAEIVPKIAAGSIENLTMNQQNPTPTITH